MTDELFAPDPPPTPRASAPASRWKPSGYPAPSLFAGAVFCRFRLVHYRDDGLVVMTLGHQTSRGGRLEPLGHGFNFITWVAVEETDPATGEVATFEIERAACNDHRTATEQHLTLLTVWAEKKPDRAAMPTKPNAEDRP